MAMGMAALCRRGRRRVAKYGASQPAIRATMTSTPTAPDDKDARLAALRLILRERPGADKADDALALVEPFTTPIPGGGSVTVAPAWYDLIGDLQLRLVRETPDALLTLQVDELDDLGIGVEAAIARALANLEREVGAPRVQPWHNLQRVGTSEEAFDSTWFLDRAFWRARLAEHPQGLVVAVPRTDALLFAPARDDAAVASMRRGIPGLHKEAGDWRLSSALYLFAEDRWRVLQGAAAIA
jgi:hypothetical protein